MPHDETVAGLGLEEYKYDFKTEDKPVFRAEPGLSEDIVRQISANKDEPEWMLEFRLKALEV
jgi:Fe-S cluster assembly protein SufB